MNHAEKGTVGCTGDASLISGGGFMFQQRVCTLPRLYCFNLRKYPCSESLCGLCEFVNLGWLGLLNSLQGASICKRRHDVVRDK